ncbi:MAG: hypothetical protein EHM64_02365 [Ignavibacteriae bacterium]|nr:MAG: hypothetical protein EHM64_02365 [Ignavibacteriota bacterium]
MQTSSSILTDIERRIQAVRDRQTRVDLFSNAILFLIGVIITATLLVILETLFNFSRSGRTIISVLYAMSLLGFSSGMIGRPFLRLLGFLSSRSDASVAQRVGLFFPSIRDRLLNALQLAKNAEPDSTVYSAELIDESLKDFAAEIQPLDFITSVDSSRLSLYRRWLMGIAALSIFILSIFPGTFSGAAFRLIHFTSEFTPPARYAFEIIPGNKEIVKGENVAVQVKVVSLLSPFTSRNADITIVRRQEGQENEDELNIRPDSNGNYRTIFQALRASTEYFARFADAESRHYSLTVIDRPLIRSFRMKLDYPAYTKISPRVMDEFSGDVTALPGTRVTITGAASKSLKEGSLQFGNNTAIPLAVQGEKFSASFPVMSDNSYHIAVVDEEGLSNREPIQYQIKMVPDEYPVIAIVEPGRNIDIAGDQSLNLLLQAKDDFGFSSLRLGYRLIKSRYEQAQPNYTFLPVPIPHEAGPQFELPYPWILTTLNLVPEDVVEYFAEVFDNDAVKGPKSGRSTLFLLRLPSLDEVFADVDKEHERSLDDLTQSLEDAKKLKDDIESINRDLKKNKDPDWQTQKKMEEIAKQVQEVQKKLDDVHSRLDQMTQQMQQQNVISKETLEKYLELQQLFQQLDATELQQALKQLQQQMPNISKEQLQQAMQNMTFSEERFRQSIERTLNLLKRIQIEQKVDEVKKRAEELENSQKELQEESSKSSGNPQQQQEVSKKQTDLARKEQAMEREADDLQRRMEEFFTEMPADQLQKSIKQLQEQQVHQNMEQASRQIQNGNLQSAQQTQDQVRQQLRQFRDQMTEMQQQMLQQQSQMVMNEMRKAANNLLELSKDEEALKRQSQNAPENSPQLRQNAQDQLQAVQDLNNVIKGLSNLSQKSFMVTPEMGKAIGEALARMNNAMRALETRSGARASQEQGQAMASLNRAAIQVQNALQSMMQGGGGGAGSLLQQLQRMAGQQGVINMQTQQMGGMSQEQAAEAARLAKEQGAVQKSLEELNREAQQSGEQKKLLGDLQKIADEMNEVVKNLEQNNVNPETVRKQERILSRLLDASKSMNERDYEKKRKAETGTPVTRRSPNEIDLTTQEGKNQLREELLKALEQGYSKDYQELIRKYFEELEKTEKLVH